MEKKTPDHPHDLTEHAELTEQKSTAPPDGAETPPPTWYAPDSTEADAAVPRGWTEEGDEDEHDPFAEEPAPVNGVEVPGDGESVDRNSAARNNRVIREVAEILLIVALVFLGVRSAVQNFKVEGDSMIPTLHTEQYLLVNRALYTRFDANFLGRVFDPNAPADMHYLFQQPQRGDIVVFESPTEPRDFIKRVVAVEGETVEVRPDFNPGGRPGDPCGGCGVYVNGVLLGEPYVRETPDYQVPPTLVPPGYVFVLGDNRRNSSDSHIFGPLAVERIVGVAFMSYLPVERFGWLSHPTYARIEPVTQP